MLLLDGILNTTAPAPLGDAAPDAERLCLPLRVDATGPEHTPAAQRFEQYETARAQQECTEQRLVANQPHAGTEEKHRHSST